MLPSKGTLRETVYIDENVGKETQFIFDYNPNGAIDITLTSPSGKVYDTSSPVVTYSPNGIYIYRFKNISEV